MQFTLHSWEMIPEVDERGYFKRTKHHLVRFALEDISLADLGRFTAVSHILFGLGFSSAADFQATGTFSVDLDSAMGGDLCGSFRARSGQVLEVVSCNSRGQIFEPCSPPNGDPAPPLSNSGVAVVPPSVS